MSYKINFGSAVLALPASLLDNLELADSIDIKTLICLVASPDLTLAEAADVISERLQCRRDKVEAAIKYWTDAGLIYESAVIGAAEKKPTASAEISEQKAAINAVEKVEKNDSPSADKKLRDREAPIYNGEELQSLLDADNGHRRLLLAECQRTFGKVFNVTEANKVVVLSDYLNLSDDHILMLFKYCHDHEKNSVHYVSAMAFNLYDEGIDTEEKLDAYLKRREVKEDFESRLRALIGCGERAFSSNEKKHISRWLDEFKYGFEIVKRAFEITCDRIANGKSPFAYMNKILESWHDKGFASLEEIDAAEREFKESKAGGESYGNFDTDEFYGLALKKTAEIIGDAPTAQTDSDGDEDGI